METPQRSKSKMSWGPPGLCPIRVRWPINSRHFSGARTHFAIVVDDEYGEVQGLITLEDIIEEIIGDIKDEHDTVASGIKPQEDGSYIVEGTVPLRDLNRAFNWSLPDEEATTIAGLVIHDARMIPDVGQVFNFHGFRLEVLKKRKHQVTSVKLTPENSGLVFWSSCLNSQRVHPFLQFECQNLVNHAVLLNP